MSARGGRTGTGGATDPFEIEFAGERLKVVESVKVGANVDEPFVFEAVDDPVPDRAGRGGGGGGRVRGTGSVSECVGRVGRGGMTGRCLTDSGR